MPDKRQKLPNTASVAVHVTDEKLSAPSASRNAAAIVQAISTFVPVSGKALEIASGTGQHIVKHAAAFPNVTWQPTDIDTGRLDSIAAWSADANLPNILAPKMLDATAAGWATRWADQDLIILSNLLHLISEAEATTVISQSAQALTPGGVFLIYGPFLRGSNFASEADKHFHESLQSNDLEIGYKSFQLIQSAQFNVGLAVSAPIEMPSNNLLLVARKLGE